MKENTGNAALKEDNQIASPEEVKQAICGLSSTDYGKLMLIARYFARMRLVGDVIEPADLLHNSIVKTLDGRRHWNKTVTFVRHLDRVMESDSGHRAEECAKHRKVEVLDSLQLSTELGSDHGNGAEVVDRIELLFRMFNDDHIVSSILQLKLEGCPAAVIQKRLGLQKQEYDAATKRIRRRIAKFIAEGGE